MAGGEVVAGGKVVPGGGAAFGNVTYNTIDGCPPGSGIPLAIAVSMLG